MMTYYRFYFSTEEILEFDTRKVSFAEAERKAQEFAQDFGATCEYRGVVTHKEI